MDYQTFSFKALINLARDFAEHNLSALGYNEVSFNQIYSYDGETIHAMFYVNDDFQSAVDYKHREQHGSIVLDFPLSTAGLLNREQRELRVMLAQQGESTALHDLMISTAGRAFVEALCAERSKYAQLCDLRQGE